PYLVQALMERPAVPDKNRLLLALRRYCGRVEPLYPDPGALAFMLREHVSVYDGKPMPLQLIVAPAAQMPAKEQLEESLAQTWEWEKAKETVARCRSALILSDMMGSGLERDERMELFYGFVRAVLDEAPVLALHWLPSQRLVEPRTFLQALHEERPLLAATVNVRMFQPRGGGAEERVMDTMGLAAFGLPDLQCRFRDRDPGKVAALLYNIAHYVFENGDVLADGNTVPGTEPGEQWPCKRVAASSPPNRQVVEIVPAGKPLKN
ncbi:MAG: DUF4261 domain-containing protein, partial [Myxococcales bacterium]